MLRTLWKTYGTAAFWIAIALVLPVFLRDEYYLMVVTLCLIYAMVSTSLNLILGYTGQASMAQGAFFGIGAYATSLLMLRLGLSFWIALPLAILITGVFGFMIGLVALRTSGGYFAIATLMFNIIVTTVIDRWDALTEGPRGLMGIPLPPAMGPVNFQSRTAYYYLSLAGLLLTLWVVYQLMRSMWGKALVAVRGNEPLARSVGIDAMWVKTCSFTLSTMLAALGGGLYACYLGFISPESSSFLVSFTALINVIIGGMGTLAGPIIGTFIMTFLMEYFQTFVEYATFFMGIILLLFIIYLPGGIVWGLRALRFRFRLNRARKRKNAHATA